MKIKCCIEKCWKMGRRTNRPSDEMFPSISATRLQNFSQNFNNKTLKFIPFHLTKTELRWKKAFHLSLQANH